MNPISWLPRVEDLARDGAGGHGGGAGVEREMRDDLADFLTRNAVGQGALRCPGS
jgi:hypothetical protein